MRLLFFIMLLVNVAAFAYFTFREQGVGQNKPALPALNAERIRLLNADQRAGNHANSLDQPTCWLWSGFKPEELEPARAELDKLALGDKLTQPLKEEFWLYIAPLKNKQEAEKKLAELKALTIEDGTLLEERDKWRFAISFAVYPTEDVATVRLNQLKEKGVKSAKILKRDVAGDTFVIQRADEKIASDLSTLQARFAETVLKQFECKTP